MIPHSLCARYIPCHPVRDGVGFCTVSYAVTTPLGPTMRHQVLVLHYGRPRQTYGDLPEHPGPLRGVPLRVLEAMTMAYETWVRLHTREEG